VSPPHGGGCPSVKERLLGGWVTSIVIVCLILKDVREGNSIDDIVRRHNPQSTAAALLLWWTGTWAFIVAII
jgi:hypothetical protein